jgi:hypothetical protein
MNVQISPLVASKTNVLFIVSLSTVFQESADIFQMLWVQQCHATHYLYQSHHRMRPSLQCPAREFTLGESEQFVYIGVTLMSAGLLSPFVPWLVGS